MHKTGLKRPDSAGVRTALLALAKAHAVAQSVGQPEWEFALEIQALGEIGADYTDVRWLIVEGLVEHRLEETPADPSKRSFRITNNLALLPESRFCITPRGLEFVQLHTTSWSLEDLRQVAGRFGVASEQRATGVQPCWDTGRRELWLGSQLVKAVRGRATNQEPVLAYFQQQGWPQCIECPLAATGNQSRSERLAHALKALNRGHQVHILRFRGNGTGRYICWEVVPGATGRDAASLDRPWHVPRTSE